MEDWSACIACDLPIEPGSAMIQRAYGLLHFDCAPTRVRLGLDEQRLPPASRPPPKPVEVPLSQRPEDIAKMRRGR